MAAAHPGAVAVKVQLGGRLAARLPQALPGAVLERRLAVAQPAEVQGAQASVLRAQAPQQAMEPESRQQEAQPPACGPEG